MYDVNTASCESQARLKLKWVQWSAVAAGALLLTGCESDDQDDAGASDLLWHASEHEVVSVRADGDSILFTTDSTLYRIEPDNTVTELQSLSGNALLVEVLGPEHYVIASGRPSGYETLDGGSTWTALPASTAANAALLRRSMRLGNRIYFRYSNGLVSTNTALGGFDQISGDSADHQYWSDYGLSLTYNEARDQLWWGEVELVEGEGPQLHIQRLDRRSGRVDRLWTDTAAVFNDGSADYYDSSVMILGGEGGLLRTMDNGSNWQSYPDNGAGLTVYAVTQDGLDGNFYAFVRNASSASDQLWCSNDQGESWTRNQFGNDNVRVASDTLLITERQGQRKIIVASPRGVFEAPIGRFRC